MLETYINIELANPLTKCTLLVTRFQVQVLKPCKSFQESSEEVLDFEARHIESIEV